jgi:hypothetical protein
MTPRSPTPVRIFLPAFAAAVLGFLPGCDTDAENVCTDIGNCAQDGSYTFIEACQAQAQELGTEASASGCAALYDDYYSCADANYNCVGITPTFAGCDASLAALEACLDAAEAENSCGQLDAALAACSGGAPDGGAAAGSSGTANPPCSVGGVCEAHCYLTSIADVCAPRPAELGAFSQCASQCTF